MKESLKITNDISVAGQLTPEQIGEAAQEGFRSVLNLREPDEDDYWPEESWAVEETGMTYAHIPLSAKEPKEEAADEILTQIDSLPKPLLVHCATAKRSGAMVLMDMACHEGMTPEQAFQKAHELGFNCDEQPELKSFFESYLNKNERHMHRS